MAAEARELRERATQLLTKGRFVKAAEVYEEYCALERKDYQARLRQGDAWSKAGQPERAMRAYQAAAEGWAKEGFLPRAIAASKLILELDPKHQGVQKMLADLYARKSGAARTSRLGGPGASSPNGISVGPEPIELVVELTSGSSGAAVAATSQTAAVSSPRSDAASAPGPAERRAESIEIEVEAAAHPAPTEEHTLELELGGDGPEALEKALGAEGSGSPVPLQVARDGGEPAVGRRAEASAVAVEEAARWAFPPEGRQAVETLLEPRGSSRAASVLAPPSTAAPDLGAPAAARLGLTATSSSHIRLPEGAEADSEGHPQRGGPPVVEGSLSLGPEVRGGASEHQRSIEPEPLVSGESAVGRAGVAHRSPALDRPVSSESGVMRAGLEHEGPTELERSLAQFEQAEPVSPPGSRGGFTELEPDLGSVLHAVEAAARSGPAAAGELGGSMEEPALEVGEEARFDPGELPRIPLFSDLPPEAFIALFEECPLRRCEVGDLVVEQGHRGDSFFVVCAGAVRVYRTEGQVRRELAQLEEGAFFGEMAVLSEAPRTASVEAAAPDTQLLEVSASVLKRLSARYPSVAAALKRFCRQRLLINLMNGSPLFRPFTKTERRELVQRFRARDARAGEVLLREGTPSDGLYVVLSGEVEVLVAGQRVARLQEGEVFGEMSLLTRSAATASVRAARRTSLLRLPQRDFEQLIMSHPQILELVSELSDERQRANSALTRHANATASMV